jgi:hypothetical protein
MEIIERRKCRACTTLPLGLSADLVAGKTGLDQS